MELFGRRITLFRPNDDTLSADVKTRVQLHRLLSLIGTVLIPLFGVFYAEEGISMWLRIGVTLLFAGLFVGSYASAHVRRHYAAWMRGLLIVALAWVVWVSSVNHFAQGYDLSLLLAYAVFIPVVGFGATTITPVFWFSVFGFLFGVVGVTVDPAPETNPVLLLSAMATIAVVGSVVIYGHLTNWRRLRERERRLRWAQRLASLGYWRRDLDSEVIEWSEETYRILGRPESFEVTPESLLNAVHPDDRDALKAAQKAAVEGEQEMDMEYRICRPSGEERVLHERGALLRDDDGSPTAIMGAVLDVTGRKETERELRDTSRLLEKTFESLAEAVIVVDPAERKIINCNWAVRKIFGYEPEELIGKSTEVLHVDEAAYREFAEVGDPELDEKGRFEVEYRMRRKDGEIIETRTVVTPLKGSDWPQGVVSVVRDVTERKNREQQLRVLSKAIEQAGDAVLITNADSLDEPGPEIVYANPAFEEMTGYSVEEIKGQSPRFLQGPKTEPWVLDRVRRRLEDGRRFEGEIINYRKDGTPFVNRWSAAPVRNTEGTITHWVSVQRDVTEQRLMGKRILEVQDEQRRRIDKEIHDEMGGLLATLQLTVDQARLATETAGLETEAFDEIVRLLDELAGVTRAISRRLHPGDLDEHGLDSTLRSLSSKFRDRHDLTIEVESEIDEGERFPSLVETTVYRVVQESLLNVVRHAETDEASVELEKADGKLHVEVIDDGEGFDPEEEEKKTFGLAGMTERVERLNGDLRIQTSRGEGTKISATLPLAFTLSSESGDRGDEEANQ